MIKSPELFTLKAHRQIHNCKPLKASFSVLSSILSDIFLLLFHRLLSISALPSFSPLYIVQFFHRFLSFSALPLHSPFCNFPLFYCFDSSSVFSPRQNCFYLWSKHAKPHNLTIIKWSSINPASFDWLDHKRKSQSNDLLTKIGTANIWNRKNCISNIWKESAWRKSANFDAIQTNPWQIRFIPSITSANHKQTKAVRRVKEFQLFHRSNTTRLFLLQTFVPLSLYSDGIAATADDDDAANWNP